MIVADGGYGLMYLGLCLYLKFKYPNLKGSSKRFLNLATILASACIIWGILTSAFFGISISPKSWLGKLSIVQYLAEKKADYHLAHHDDVYQFWTSKYSGVAQVQSGQEFLDAAVKIKDHHIEHEVLDSFSDSILLEFSLLIGVIHISLALLRYLLRNWCGNRVGDLHGRGLYVFSLDPQGDVADPFHGHCRQTDRRSDRPSINLYRNCHRPLFSAFTKKT